ncbi:iron-containing alcohol dehydrogenase [Mesorhizobium sp. B2-7-3]|uniref:iron-containing alcohol dehydrogenase n=1 Tax=Mesorhizobium sp. B2-7-3 TaxID=2589907 RepID=UPI001129D9DC|nr:iron-containing alcohol dehydrogenase [Mesorhizobium sp. B2-7-3]TPJ18862.1 iron-containing alcohol dehydrogenase [Mesorhizobium sp. B2-7-3]
MAVIAYLTDIEFGSGSLAQLPGRMERLRISRPLLVSDHGVVSAGLVDKIVPFLPEDLPVFLDVPSNPTEAATLAAVELYRNKGCDGVVVIGGGSPVDLAKGVALLATHQGNLARYALIEGGLEKITAEVAPVIAIPTTAGTGAEVGRAALITLEDGRKLGFVSPHLIPKCAICDPELTMGMPPGLTAATALDALSHCLETYLSPRDNAPAEAIALDGAVRIWTHVRAAFHDGSNLVARTALMMGALEGGLMFQKGLGAIHALSHAMGGLKSPNLHHGTLNAILLPAVMAINRPMAEPKFERIEAVLGIETGGLVGALNDLNHELGIPIGLKTLGVKEEQLSLIVERALADHSHATNPLPLTPDEYRQVLLAVMH